MKSRFIWENSHRWRRASVFALTLLLLFLTVAQADEPERQRAEARVSSANSVLDEPETFDGAGTPAGWSVIDNIGTGGWRFDDPGGRGNGTGGAGNFAIADSDFLGEDTQMDTELRTPPLDLSGTPTVRLTFRTFFEAFGDSKGAVDVSADGGNSWTNVWQATGNNVQGVQTVDLSAQAANQANVVVRFRYYDANYAWFWQIDDVNIEGVAGPTAPDNLNAVAGGGSQINLDWTDSDNETSFEIERSTNGNNGFTRVRTVAANQTTATDSQGLACATQYFYRVRAVNGAGASGYSNVANATTGACAAFNSLNENFNTQALPGSWNIAAAGWDFNDPTNLNGSVGATPGFASVDSTNAQTPELRTPTLDLSGKPAVTLTFDTRLNLYSQGAADVDVSLNGGNTWTNVWRSGNNISGNPLRGQTVDLSAVAGGRSNVILRFRTNATDVIWIVDNVALDSATAPTAPSNLTATLGNNNVVNLTWTNPSGAAIEVQKSQDNTNWATLVNTPAGATSTTDNNVVTGQTYFYRVRATGAAGNTAFSNVANVQIAGDDVRTFDLIISLYHSTASAQTNRAAIENNVRYFADAVYEMSNGAHRLGRVNLYPNRGFITQADVVWEQRCWPNAYVSGRARATGPNGKRIEHCDLFFDDQNNEVVDNFLQGDAGQRRGGYTLAHEWGHYFYSMLDEYRGGGACNPNDPGGPCNEDTPVQFSVMNSQSQAANGDFRWLNFSVPQTNNSPTNAHYRVYRASAWETLSRPLNQDPAIGENRNGSIRIYYPELQNKQPGANQLPSLELPGGQGAARAALQLIWPATVTAKAEELAAQSISADSTVRQVVIDHSGNMSAAQLDDVKNGVNLLIDQAQIGDTFGIIGFTNVVTQVQAPLTIQSPADKNTLKAAVDGLTASTLDSAAGDALQTALDGLQNAGVSLNQVVYLITAGPHQTGVHPTSLVPTYQEADVSLYSFGYDVSDGVATTLEQIAEQTGGFYRFVGNRSDLQKALNAADKAASPVSPVYITLDGAIIDPNQTEEFSFHVDSTLGGLEVGVSYLNVLTGATLSLIDPNMTVNNFPADNCEDWSGFDFDVETVCYLSLEGVASGDWTLRVEAGAEEVDVLYWADGIPLADTTTFNANAESLPSDAVAYPTPILLSAAVGTDLPITDITVEGNLYSPSGSVTSFTMRDDGVAPDEKAQDGIYGALLNYNSNGYHTIEILFSNSGGQGKFTNAALFPARHPSAPAPDGRLPQVSLTPVGQNFQRFAEFQVYVTGVEGDDHADSIFDETNPPTNLTVDNVGIPGQIDYANDADTFEVTVPDDYDGELVIRVADLGFEMDPDVYLFADDYSWEFNEYFEFVPDSSDVLNIPLTVGEDVSIKPGDTFFVQVYHFDEEAEEGTYTISAGPTLGGDQPVVSNDDSKTSYIYLPTIVK